MQHGSAFFGLIAKALRADYDKIAHEPLPERWVDLIQHLNERERAEADRESSTTASQGRAPLK